MNWLWFSFACAALHGGTIPRITAAPDGPYRVVADRILDSKGNSFLIRGAHVNESSSAVGFGAFSGTTFITIRQRLNMNAVRLRVDSRVYEASGGYRARVKKIVDQANRFELLAILEIASATCVNDFKANPNVFFALADVENVEHIVSSIRSAGATQPIIVAGLDRVIRDPNIIYEFSPSYARPVMDETSIGDLLGHVPLLANGLDPQLDRNGAECSAFPSDPGAASQVIEDDLTFFDEHSISWTISGMEPGKFIDDFGGYNWTKLDDGWRCGESPAQAGIAMAVLSHLWSGNPHGLFIVNQPAGGLVIARGANASAYGPILAQQDARAARFPLPFTLGGISVRVTDSRGVARLAPMSWTGAGWSNLNFVIPEKSATGPAEVALLRSDGSQAVSSIVIADVAPGLWTATNDGRGPMTGQLTQSFSDGSTNQFPAWTCSKNDCKTVPIPLTRGAATKIRIEGTGFRFTRSKEAIRVMMDGVNVPVENFGPVPGESLDRVTVKIPDELIGRGEVDLILIADGALSNVVRVNCGKR